MLYLTVDMPADLMMASDSAYKTLKSLYWDDLELVVIEGITVVHSKAQTALENYVSAWEQAWIDTAESLGHDAVASGDVATNRERDSLNPNNDPYEGHSEAEQAWQQVWDRCPVVVFTSDMLT